MGPMSGEQTDQTAPTLAQARKATAACGTLGRKAQTRSPGSTPKPRSAAASEATWRRNSSQPISSLAPSCCSASLRKTMAGTPAASAAAACEKTCLA